MLRPTLRATLRPVVGTILRPILLRPTLAAFSLVALPSAALAVPSPAGECVSDADCTDGYVCEVTGGSSCACAPEVPCDCQPVEYHSCVPGPCASDADCGAGLVCVSYEVGCIDVAAPCSSDGNCTEAPPTPCETTTESVCAPRWVLPCERASDCGEGFNCEPAEICECSGGAPTPTDPGGYGSGGYGSGSGDSPVPRSEDCTCEPTGTNACVAVEVTCEDASACPSGWTCEHMTVGVDCAEPQGGSGTPCEPPTDPVPPAPGVCFPPYAVNFDSGIPRADSSSGSASQPQYESGTAAPVDTTGGTQGAVAAGGGCAGGLGALPIGGLALFALALRRRRASLAP